MCGELTKKVVEIEKIILTVLYHLSNIVINILLLPGDNHVDEWAFSQLSDDIAAYILLVCLPIAFLFIIEIKEFSGVKSAQVIAIARGHEEAQVGRKCSI